MPCVLPDRLDTLHVSTCKEAVQHCGSILRTTLCGQAPAIPRPLTTSNSAHRKPTLRLKSLQVRQNRRVAQSSPTKCSPAPRGQKNGGVLTPSGRGLPRPPGPPEEAIDMPRWDRYGVASSHGVSLQAIPLRWPSRTPAGFARKNAHIMRILAVFPLDRPLKTSYACAGFPL